MKKFECYTVELQTEKGSFLYHSSNVDFEQANQDYELCKKHFTNSCYTPTLIGWTKGKERVIIKQ